MLRIDLLRATHDEADRASFTSPQHVRTHIAGWLRRHAAPRVVPWTVSSTLACLGIAAGMTVLYRDARNELAHAQRAHAAAARDSMSMASLLDSLRLLRITADSALAWQRRQITTSPSTSARFVAIAEDTPRRGVNVSRLAAHGDGTVTIEGHAVSVPAVLSLVQQLPASLLRDPRLDHVGTPASGVADMRPPATPATNRFTVTFRILATRQDTAALHGAHP